MNKYISFLLLCGFLMIFNDLQGQDFERLDSLTHLLRNRRKGLIPHQVRILNAFDQAKELKNGSLIILLQSGSNRLLQLDKLSNNQDFSEKQRAFFRKEKEVLQREKDRINAGLMEAFTTEYHFSDVYFTYDSSFIAILNGVRKDVFVNENQEIDTSITIKNPTIYFCRYGLISTSQQKDGLTITNIDNEKIARPFPSIIASSPSGVLQGMNFVKNDNNYAQRSIIFDVIRLELKLTELIKDGIYKIEKWSDD